MIYIIHITDGGSRVCATYSELIEKSQKLNAMSVAHKTEILNDADEAFKE